MNEQQKEIISKGIEKYGEHQLYVAIEEMSELQKELCKVLRGKPNITNISEELGDAMIMMETIKQYFNISDSVLNILIDGKLKRI